MMALALALAALALAIWLLLAYREPEPAAPAAGRSAPPDPIGETIDKWMHDWERGRA